MGGENKIYHDVPKRKATGTLKEMIDESNKLLALERKACITKTIEWFFIQLNRKVDGHPVYTLTDYVDEMGKRHYVMDINGDAVYFAQYFDWLVFDGTDWYVLTNREYLNMF